MLHHVQRRGKHRRPERCPLSLRMGFAALRYVFNFTEFTTPCRGSHQARTYARHSKKGVESPVNLKFHIKSITFIGR